MKQFLMGSAAIIAVAAPTAAFAQSTGSIETENSIIVTGARTASNGVSGVVIPDSTKARAVLTQEIIARQPAGQTILNALNLVPGVNFTQSDAYGSAGGNIRIRGFDGNRVSLTFDGIPLNDSGNYAIYPNQMLDPELIEQVNVNLGATDIDSPTASAAGGTVNYRTIMPSDDFGVLMSGSAGEDDYFRLFGMVQTGEIGPWGTKMFFAASTARNDKFKGPGGVEKQQYNARIYQPIGSNGDFISLAGHWNVNRNNFYRNPSVNDMRTLFGTGTVPASGSISAASPVYLKLTNAQQDALFNFENDAVCNSPVTGCTNYYGVRINPSNTGNVRLNSRWTLTDNLIFTVDGAYQYVLANGGGYTSIREDAALIKGSKATGVDYNGDGDTTDTIGFYTPNNTNTNRYTLLASLIWDIAPEHRVRVAYTYDRARHRQTGEWGYLGSNGAPENVFGGRNGRPVLNADGFQMQQRDRLSIALLNQVAGQYVGKFMDEKLRVEVGVRAPFFKRDLETYCPIQTSGSGFATCTSQPTSQLVIVPPTQVAPFPSNSLYAPFKADYKFNKVLPNVGLTYSLTPEASLFWSYAKGISAPRTDNLYRAPIIDITPETTDSFDLGARYTSRKIQAQLTTWYISFKNRIVTSFDADQGISVDRNVGKVEAYGVDANIAYQPIKELTLYTFASYNHSRLKNDVQIGSCSTVNAAIGCSALGQAIFAPTAGKRVTETPDWTVGGRAQVEVGPVSVGAQAKYVGSRFATDVNDVKVPNYTLVDLDARFSLAQWGAEKTYFQLNVTNLFNKFYLGNISTQINAGTIQGLNGANPNFSVGAPRTIMGTLTVGL
ncbi:TonB-dependent receptor [Sphingobium sp. HBC34]|uniref:TonB-dependent receptor n=1 Tax=Sphingobium cyanobacteriorum TaxID=3063954 RepID=A0ABT8ZRB6_9SPHN|nr:TonB-dependent receptor [Sphingobium sp. HBC34]MDO7837076.1 TonB-dependent receptor [Sphingobium sp. HBC34]